MLSNLATKGLAEDAKPEPGQKLDLGSAFQKNLTTVEGYLNMFYWGIEVGRQLAAQEKSLEINPPTAE
jgi:hypothetical protein